MGLDPIITAGNIVAGSVLFYGATISASIWWAQRDRTVRIQSGRKKDKVTKALTKLEQKLQSINDRLKRLE